MSDSYSTTFTYKGKEYPLAISVYFRHTGSGLTSANSFQVRINNIFIGNFIRDEVGLWKNLQDEPEHEKSPKALPLPFVLQAHDYQLIGELIEDNMGEWV